MSDEQTFFDLFRYHLNTSGVGISRLAILSNVPRPTIVNWVAGHVRRPHQHTIIKVAAALRLTAEQTTALLHSASHRSLAQLYTDCTNDEQTLFVFWQDALRPSPTPNIESAFDLLATMPTDVLPPRSPVPPHSRMSLAPNPLFTGREDDLRVLVRVVAGGQDAVIGSLPIAAATGLGGIGKTQLATEFVHRYGQYFAGGVFWLSFADPDGVASEVAACGGAGFLDARPDFTHLPLSDQVSIVRTLWQESIPRLLVFDNCEDDTLLRHWRPTSGGCRVIVTSRRAVWDVELGVHVHALDVLERAESVALLRKYRDDLAADDPNLPAIAAELGDLPLALQLAGRFLRRYRHAITPSAYLSALRDQPTNHLSDATFADDSPSEHARLVARSFALSRARIDPDHPPDRRALTLLRCMACCAPGESIPRALAIATLARAEGGTIGQLDGEDAIVRLQELGLTDVGTAGEVRLHRLLHRFVQLDSVMEQVRVNVEATLIDLVNSANAELAIQPVREVQQHLRYVADVALVRRDERAAALCHGLGYHLMFLWEHVEAEQYVEQAIAIRQTLPESDQLQLADSLEVMGFILQGRSEIDRPKTLYRQVLAIREPLLGVDDPETVDAHDNLGYLLMLEGTFDASLHHLHHALRKRHRTFGLWHRKTARSAHNVGTVLLEIGDYRNADRFLTLALALREKVLPPSHFSTLQTMTHLAVVKFTRGDYHRARELDEQALEERIRIRGEIHQDVAESLVHLGNVSVALGDLDTARTQYERALAINRQQFGDDGRETQGIVVPLGNLLCEQGHFDAAQACFDEAIPILDRILGPRHPGTMEARHSLGRLLAARGELEQARTLIEQTLMLRREVRGSHHMDVGRSLQHLGEVLERQKEYLTAQQCFEEAYAILRRALGQHHPWTKEVQRHGARVQQRR